MKHKALKIGASVLVCVMLLSVFAFSLVTYSDSTGNDPLVSLSYSTDVLLPVQKGRAYGGRQNGGRYVNFHDSGTRK